MTTRYGVWLKRANRRYAGRDTIRYGWAWESDENGMIVTRFQRGPMPKSAYVFMMLEDAEAYALKVAMKNPETMGHLEVRLYAVPEEYKHLFREDRCGSANAVPDHY